MNILETTHLILRTWNDSDLDPMAAIDQDPRLTQMDYLKQQKSL